MVITSTHVITLLHSFNFSLSPFLLSVHLCPSLSFIFSQTYYVSSRYLALSLTHSLRHTVILALSLSLTLFLSVFLTTLSPPLRPPSPLLCAPLLSSPLPSRGPLMWLRRRGLLGVRSGPAQSVGPQQCRALSGLIKALRQG